MATSEPYRHCVIDLETAHGRPEDAELRARLEWTPAPSWKPATVGERWRKALDKALADRALIDEAPIVAISIKSDTEHGCLHTCRPHDWTEMHGAQVAGFSSEREMFEAFAEAVGPAIAADTVVVGFNSRRFDLPRLRLGHLRSGVRLPDFLVRERQPTYDLMERFCTLFSVSDRRTIALAAALQTLGIPSHKSIVSGAEIPELYASGQHDLFIRYSLLDVVVEEDLYLRMTGATAGAPNPGGPLDATVNGQVPAGSPAPAAAQRPERRRRRNPPLG